VGGAFLVLGLILATTGAATLWHRRRPGVLDSVVLACAAVTVGAAPFLAWRVVEDIRYTTGLDATMRDGAGPVQAFLAPYLLDPVPAIVPEGDTYAIAVGDGVPHATARKAFPALAQNVLFPRVSVADPRRAEWVVAWGIDPRSVAPVGRVVVARRAFATNPPVLVARVRR